MPGDSDRRRGIAAVPGALAQARQDVPRFPAGWSSPTRSSPTNARSPLCTPPNAPILLADEPMLRDPLSPATHHRQTHPADRQSRGKRPPAQPRIVRDTRARRSGCAATTLPSHRPGSRLASRPNLSSYANAWPAKAADSNHAGRHRRSEDRGPASTAARPVQTDPTGLSRATKNSERLSCAPDASCSRSRPHAAWHRRRRGLRQPRCQGLMISTPVSSKSATLRVATAKP